MFACEDGTSFYFLIFGVRKLFVFTVSKSTWMFVLFVKSKELFLQFKTECVNELHCSGTNVIPE